jgi:hypothetical protein
MIAIGQLANGLAIFTRAPDDFVINVGDVTHVGKVIAAGPQPTRDHVEHDHNPGVSEMTIVVDGHAADVHVHAAWRNGYKGLLFAGKGVVYLQHGKVCSPGKGKAAIWARKAGIISLSIESFRLWGGRASC